MEARSLSLFDYAFLCGWVYCSIAAIVCNIRWISRRKCLNGRVYIHRVTIKYCEKLNNGRPWVSNL